MSTKDKKIKSSKADDKKNQKKLDDAAIAVDRSNTESTPTKGKEDGGNTAESSINGEAREVLQSAPAEEEKSQQDEPVVLTDVNKLTEILVEK